MYLVWKDEKFLNKILLIILLIIFILMIFSSSCFASSNSNSEYTYTINSINRCLNISFNDNLEDYSKYLFIFNEKDNFLNVSLFYSNSDFIFDNNTGHISSNSSLLFSHFSQSFYMFETYGDSSFDFNDSTFSIYQNGFSSGYLKGGSISYYGTIKVTDNSGNILFSPEPTFLNPSFITTKEELASGNFDTLKIDAGDLDYTDDEFGLAIFDITSNSIDIAGNKLPTKATKTFILNGRSDYVVSNNLDLQYYIPQQSLGVTFENNKKYLFCLANIETGEVYNSVSFTVGGLTAEEELKNKQDEMNQKLDDQTNAIKESNETNKNIFERIGEMLSYINPFSENFFVYKLIELLIEAIKSLFIPSNDFFDTYFTDLKEWFGDRLGFLFYPFELIIDILTKILNVNFSSPIFNIPDMYEPVTNHKLINATTFNFNSMLENNIFNTVHSIYLICVDAFIVFELVNLFRRKYEEVTTK